MDWYLPGTKAGGPVRSVFSLVSLLKNEFDFYIITTNTDLGSSEEYATIVANTFFIKDEINYYYFKLKSLTNVNVVNIITQINPDLIYLNSFWSFNFSIKIIRLKNRHQISAPILLAPRGMLSKGALSLKAFKKKSYLLLAKRLGWYKNIYFHATNRDEEKDIKKWFPNAVVKIASNVNAGKTITNTALKKSTSLNLFFLSRISKVKNLHFALEVLKNIPKDIKINYDIYGNIEDHSYWQKCLEIIKLLPKNISVTYKKELAFNEVQTIIGNYHALFLPTLNENFGHSIVESLLTGCLAIISDQTPWHDIEKNNAGFAISLNNKQRFVDVIIELASLNQDAFLQKSLAANNYISSKVETEKNSHLYKTLFNGFIKN